MAPLSSSKEKMMDKVLKEIEMENERRKKTMNKIWAIDYHIYRLEEFLNFILGYFGINIKDRLDFENEYEYFYQENRIFNLIDHLLTQIKPFLLLGYKLSQITDIDNAFKEEKIKEDSMVNMIDNFIRLRRTGRNRKLSQSFLEDFKKFKQKHQNFVDLYNETEQFDGITTGSILDYARAIRKYDLTKEQFKEFIHIFRFYRQNIRFCSNRTLYRYDKDLVKFNEMYYSIKHIYQDYDFYMKCLQE